MLIRTFQNTSKYNSSLLLSKRITNHGTPLMMPSLQPLRAFQTFEPFSLQVKQTRRAPTLLPTPFSGHPNATWRIVTSQQQQQIYRTYSTQQTTTTTNKKGEEGLFQELIEDLDAEEVGGEASSSSKPIFAEEFTPEKTPTKRHRRRLGLGPKEVSARLSGIKGSMKKVKVMCDLVKGLNYREAVAQLTLAPQRASSDIRKLLKIAKSHAENNLGLDPDRLLVAYFYIGRHQQIRQVEFRARGRANFRLRRRTKVEVVLREIPRYAGEKRLGRYGRLNSEYKNSIGSKSVPDSFYDTPTSFIDMTEDIPSERIQDAN